ncbi:MULTISPECIES: flagellar biosynthesis protein FliQ [Salinivibrio]|jgi:flagellar biosynthetic protein FliQ|uniref:Flagellar biosynthetic protein FliQ n=1 Tax=Salinivibrio costicola subsp. alcaliphilus TaxID=272773 RepID=A0ABX3KTN2_SALCS|nr:MULTISPECIES: flagellar biosynthesis protein FliQ [Salinivibrio]NUY56295.1 flagellar biosynthesis protein FliQ [Salinivibrio sp. EAGSL]OOE93268.1 flagellar export apparatus protein FliQ [Salinivibrio sp. AR647]OOE93570.1 flagellar export apparatus protein FliQ [Salinivibrio sp. AR640]OOE99113.1 flagellar export apparatus protein FliQ [Salinivibrio sp. IB643]OOF00642.1 flagellar export apparatus protein FliQ [Salinivibrio sp. MA351]
MAPEAFVELFQDALYLVLLLVSAIVVPGLLVGLIVAVFQAATSINEQTLSFLPRLIATFIALMFFGHWMTRMLMEYFYRLIDHIPTILY